MKTLKEWCLENRAEGTLRCYIKGENPIPPDEIGYTSSRYYRWVCESCGLSWHARANTMIRRTGNPCPYCSHQKPSPFYNAAVLYPELRPYWDGSQNEGALEDYLPGSLYEAHWRCDRFHSWTRKIAYQVDIAKHNSKNLCPYCSNQRVSATYNLEIVCPEVARQWNYVKNGALTPRDVTPYSQQKVYWVCSYNPTHEWADRISNRTQLLRGCPHCNRQFRISYVARAVYYYLLTNHIACRCEASVGPYLIDILIDPLSPGDAPIALEIDGYYTHSREESVRRDAAKDAYLTAQRYRVIRVKDTPQKENGIFFENDQLIYPYSERREYLDGMICCLAENWRDCRSNRITPRIIG